MSTFHFPAWTNHFKLLIPAGAIGGAIYAVVFVWFGLSPKTLNVGYRPEQPIPFSHALHAGELKMDCLYCHNTVDEAGHAAIPPTATCMNCHKQIWANTEMLEPVRQSWATGERLQWNRVNDLPDYVFFNHSIHVHKGIGCQTCHGRVDEMPLMVQQHSLQMRWCLECHRDPAAKVRPREHVFDMDWEASDEGMSQRELGEELVVEYEIESLDYCSVCHR